MRFKVNSAITSKMSEHDDYIFLQQHVLTGEPYEIIKCGKTEEYVGKLHYESDGWFIETRDSHLYYILVGAVFLLDIEQTIYDINDEEKIVCSIKKMKDLNSEMMKSLQTMSSTI